MPRDKTLSHIRVNKAIKEEFLEKGYEAASIRSIGARAGMTSAGLYRHYPDKEAMFAAMVDPLIGEIRDWAKKHKARKNILMDDEADKNRLFDETYLDLVRNVILPRRDEFKILMTCSRGTRYENFIQEYAMDNQREFLEAISTMKARGYPIVDIDEEELHMLLTVYITACFEPVLRDCGQEQIDKYLNTVHEFFMPGWMRIMGLD